MGHLELTINKLIPLLTRPDNTTRNCCIPICLHLWQALSALAAVEPMVVALVLERLQVELQGRLAVHNWGPGGGVYKNAVACQTAVWTDIVGQLWSRWTGVVSCARQVFPREEVRRARAQPAPYNKAADGVECWAVPCVLRTQQSFLAVLLAGFYRPAVIAKSVKFVTQVTI
jgi:hypothetical protein